MPDDALPPTGEVTRDSCPEYEPLADPVKELVVVRWCPSHQNAAIG